MHYSVNDLIQKAADKTGFKRERYKEAAIPDDYSSIEVIVGFPNIREEVALSSLVLGQYKSKYLILCSYPKHGILYPYADEYWGSSNDKVLQFAIDSTAKDTYNLTLVRQLNQYFANVSNMDLFSKYYDNGITQKYLDDYKKIVRIQPEIPSVPAAKGRSVFFCPTKLVYSWREGCTQTSVVTPDFWRKMIDKLLDNGFMPVVWQTDFSYDMSKFYGDKCSYCITHDIGMVLGHMRNASCVLDVANDISRYALLARCPFVSLTERKRYCEIKEFELDAIHSSSKMYRYLFGFVSMLETGKSETIISALISKVYDLCESSPDLPSANQQTIDYDVIKKVKSRQMALRFVRRNHEEYDKSKS